MDANHHFLDRLGLAQDADARAIRRAYARELKQIDQERDPGGFQQLRDCYETALQWAAWKVREEAEQAAGADGAVPAVQEVAQEAVQEAVHEAVQEAAQERVQEAAQGAARVAPEAAAPVPAVPPAEPKPPAPRPFELGRLAFAAFEECIPALNETGGEPRDRPWIEALRAMLDDERLINLEARLSFEIHVAYLLANGWRPGHEILFRVAAAVFGWESDRRATARLGEAGPTIDAALDEGEAFRGQDSPTRVRQGEVLELLRQPHPPSDRRILRDMEMLEQMLRHFPNWLPLNAPLDNVGFWRKRYAEQEKLKGKAFEVQEPAPPPEARRWWQWRGWSSAGKPTRISLTIALITLVRLLASLAGSNPSAPPETAAQERERLTHPKPIYVDEAPPKDRLQEISTRIAYKPKRDARPGKLTAHFQVFLDADGSVLGTNKLQGSGDKAFDDAVAQAIRGTAPFPPKTVKMFNVSYSVTITLGPKPGAHAPAGSPRKHAPAAPPLGDDAPRDGDA